MTASGLNGNGVSGTSNGHEVHSSNKPLAGKVAIVTGSSRGIGAGIALDLGKRGASVVVNHSSASSAEAGEAVVKVVREAGSEAVLVQADVVSSTGIKRIVQSAVALSTSGKIDILVHNAGHGDDRYLEDIDEAFYEIQTNINMKGPIFLTQAALPYLARGGRIVIISSVSSRMGVPQQAVYAATKAANEAMARVWATELGTKYGVTINCVAPGPIATEMYYASDHDFLNSMQPLIESTPAEHRVGEVNDVVPIVGFLCSEESRWVTGGVVSASGGLSF